MVPRQPQGFLQTDEGWFLVVDDERIPVSKDTMDVIQSYRVDVGQDRLPIL